MLADVRAEFGTPGQSKTARANSLTTMPWCVVVVLLRSGEGLA
jgi:hypothetical protein